LSHERADRQTPFYGESYLYSSRVDEIVSVVDHVSIKSDLALFMSLLQKWCCLGYLDLLNCASDFLHMRSKYRRRTLALIISGDIYGAGVFFMDFNLTGACL